MIHERTDCALVRLLASFPFLTQLVRGPVDGSIRPARLVGSSLRKSACKLLCQQQSPRGYCSAPNVASSETCISSLPLDFCRTRMRSRRWEWGAKATEQLGPYVRGCALESIKCRYPPARGRFISRHLPLKLQPAPFAENTHVCTQSGQIFFGDGNPAAVISR